MNVWTVAQIIFWTGAAALLYTYAGYPLLLAIVSRLRPRAIKNDAVNGVAPRDWTPFVSMIIAAHNEERDLEAKLENSLALDYPSSKLEIIVASDCSTDGTDDIVRRFAARQEQQAQQGQQEQNKDSSPACIPVRLHRQRERRGKTAAQNAAVELARGEILLFSDATTLYRPDVLRALLPNFADASVGCVAGRLLYVDPSQSGVGSGAKSYWGYETFLKECESRIGSLIGVSGCLYAVRRSAYVPLPDEACSDFIIATVMVEQGLRAVYEPAAVCTEETNRRADKEFKMRVRIITQTYNDLWRHRAMLNPLRSGFYAVQLLSHKVLRYLVPVFLLMMLAASAVLAPRSPFYAVVFGLQIFFYTTAALGRLIERVGAHSRLLALPHYFVLANWAAVVALWQFLRGERYARWDTAREGTNSAPIGNAPANGAASIASRGSDA